MDGEHHDVDALLESGRNVALIFWQTWCSSCKKEAPKLARAVREHGDEIRFFGIVSGPDRAVDDDKVRRVAREWNHPQPQIRDRDLSLTRRFKVRGTPVIVILGRDREILYRGYRLPKSWATYRGADAPESAEPPSGDASASDPSGR
jgi:thiol-disulfide isomerase/thioredoxin